MEDIRIYISLDAFSKSCSLVETAYAKYLGFEDNGKAAFLALLPYMSSEDWYTTQIMELLALHICRAMAGRFNEGHPMSQITRILLRKLPTIAEQSAFWSQSARRYDSQIPYSFDTWYTSTLNDIRFARRCGNLKAAINSCEQAIYTPMRHNIPSRGHRAHFLFEYARTLQVSSHWHRAVVIYPQALKYAEMVKDHRLAIKACIRLAQVYDYGLSDFANARMYYTLALVLATVVFGTDHSHTMLAFVQLRNFRRRQPSTLLDIIGNERYEAASAHYASIDDLAIEEGGATERTPRTEITRGAANASSDVLLEENDRGRA